MRFETGNPSVITPYLFERIREVPREPISMGREIGRNRQRMAGEVFFEDLDALPIRLNTRDLVIPPPSQKFKSNPDYTPTMLPGLIDREILNPGLMGASGFGVT